MEVFYINYYYNQATYTCKKLNASELLVLMRQPGVRDDGALPQTAEYVVVAETVYEKLHFTIKR